MLLNLAENIQFIIDVLHDVDKKLANFVVLLLVSLIFNVINFGKLYLERIQTISVRVASFMIDMLNLLFLYQLRDDEEVDVLVQVVGKV